MSDAPTSFFTRSKTTRTRSQLRPASMHVEDLEPRRRRTPQKSPPAAAAGTVSQSGGVTSKKRKQAPPSRAPAQWRQQGMLKKQRRASALRKSSTFLHIDDDRSPRETAAAHGKAVQTAAKSSKRRNKKSKAGPAQGGALLASGHAHAGPSATATATPAHLSNKSPSTEKSTLWPGGSDSLVVATRGEVLPVVREHGLVGSVFGEAQAQQRHGETASACAARQTYSTAAFCIDRSGSMGSSLGLGNRFSVVTAHLLKLLEGQPDSFQFAVLVFNNSVQPWRGGALVTNTPENRQALLAFLATHGPSGGTHMLHAAQALLAVAGCQERFLLTDGQDSYGNSAQVVALAGSQQMPINCIGVGLPHKSTASETLQTVAAASGGACLFLDDSAAVREWHSQHGPPPASSMMSGVMSAVVLQNGLAARAVAAAS